MLLIPREGAVSVVPQPHSSLPGIQFSVRTLSPCPYPPGLSLQTVAGAAGLCPRGDGTETCRCSRAARGCCRCAVCARFPWGPCRGLLLLPGWSSILPCPGTIRGHRGLGVVNLSLAPGPGASLSPPASPRDLASREGRVAQGQRWRGRALARREVRPGHCPRLVLIRCASPSPSGA